LVGGRIFFAHAPNNPLGSGGYAFRRGTLQTICDLPIGAGYTYSVWYT
jgi:hypothetical protein